MRKAIDNYAKGKQIEVTAWSGQSISASTRRFFCPECMESVALDIRGHFRHKNRTAQSLECEKRVDSPSRTSYERMGLPLFIRSETDGIFKLYLGFPAIPQKILDEAQTKKAIVKIGTGKIVKSQLFISAERFDAEHITYCLLDFLPAENSKYKIDYENTPYIIRQRWTDESDFWGNGQFFKKNDIYSRKIRPLGTIVANQDYYFLGSTYHFQQYSRYIEIAKVGQLYVGSSHLSVYKINIHAENASDAAFKNLSTYLMEKYHISLLIGESELSPLWPPCLQEENYFIYPTQAKRAVFVVNSSNESPRILKYQGSAYSEVATENNAPPLFDMTVCEQETPISVDRAFNGNIQYIRKQTISTVFCENVVDIVDENGLSILKERPSKLRNKSFRIKSNCPCIVYLLKYDGTCAGYKLTSQDGVVIENVNWKDSITIMSTVGHVLLSYVFEQLAVGTKEDSQLIELIRKAKGPTITVNQSIIALCRKANEIPTVKWELARYIKLGRIPIQVVDVLKDMFGGK